MTRQEAWVVFAALPFTSNENAVKCADYKLAEYDKRFPQVAAAIPERTAKILNAVCADKECENCGVKNCDREYERGSNTCQRWMPRTPQATHASDCAVATNARHACSCGAITATGQQDNEDSAQLFASLVAANKQIDSLKTEMAGAYERIKNQAATIHAGRQSEAAVKAELATAYKRISFLENNMPDSIALEVLDGLKDEKGFGEYFAHKVRAEIEKRRVK